MKAVCVIWGPKLKYKDLVHVLFCIDFGYVSFFDSLHFFSSNTFHVSGLWKVELQGQVCVHLSDVGLGDACVYA